MQELDFRGVVSAANLRRLSSRGMLFARLAENRPSWAGFSGKDKPEPLKFELAGCWSRILQEHRLVYRVSYDRIDFLSRRGIATSRRVGLYVDKR